MSPAKSYKPGLIMPNSLIADVNLDELPTMAFESSLVAPWTCISNGHPVEIPICLGALILCLRDLHENELNRGCSFIDDFSSANPYDPPNLREDTEKLAEWLLNGVTNYSECRYELSSKAPRLLFETLLFLLGRLNEPLYPLSERTCKLLRKLCLLEPVHLYSMHIFQVLYSKAMAFCADSESRQHNPIANLDDHPSDIPKFIQKTYGCNNVSRQDKLRLTNLFNNCIFHDLYMVTEHKSRNIIRVIIRSLIFLVRRYVITMCANSKAERHETWLMNTIVMRPHIHDYAVNVLAKRVGPLMFRFPKFTCLQNELAVRAMVNILCSNTDSLWMPGQTPSTVKIDMGSAKCHPGCICQHDL